MVVVVGAGAGVNGRLQPQQRISDKLWFSLRTEPRDQEHSHALLFIVSLKENAKFQFESRMIKT